MVVMKVPKVKLTFLTGSFPMSWLFANNRRTGKVLVLFKNLHLLELKIKNFGGLPLR